MYIEKIETAESLFKKLSDQYCQDKLTALDLFIENYGGRSRLLPIIK